MNWWELIVVVFTIYGRIKSSGYHGKLRTLIVVEEPGRPLPLEEAQTKLADTGAVVLPGYTFVV